MDGDTEASTDPRAARRDQFARRRRELRAVLGLRDAGPATEDGGEPGGSRGIVSGLLRGAAATATVDPARALELARRARRLAADLDPEAHGLADLADLEASAALAEATAHRAAGDLTAAARGLDEAETLLRAGSLDPALRARLLCLRIELCVTQGRPGAARPLLGPAGTLVGWLGDRRQSSRLAHLAVLLDAAELPGAGRPF